MSTPTPQVNAGSTPPGQPTSTSGQKAGAIAGGTFCLLVAASIGAWFVQDAPMVVARKYISGLGIATDNLEPVGYHEAFVPVFPFPKTATVEFRVTGADPPKKLKVELSRIVYFIPWHGTAFEEEKAKK